MRWSLFGFPRNPNVPRRPSPLGHDGPWSLRAGPPRRAVWLLLVVGPLGSTQSSVAKKKEGRYVALSKGVGVSRWRAPSRTDHPMAALPKVTQLGAAFRLSRFWGRSMVGVPKMFSFKKESIVHGV